MTLENVHGFALLLRNFYDAGGVAVVLSSLVVSLVVLQLSNRLHPDVRFETTSVIIHWVLTCFTGIIYSIIPITDSSINTPMIFAVTIFIPVMTIWCIIRTWSLMKYLRKRIISLEVDNNRLNNQVSKKKSGI